MEITRIYNNREGDSFFELIPVLMEWPVEKGYICDGISDIGAVNFRNTKSHQVSEFIRPKVPTYATILEGSLEIEVSSGVRKRFSKGDVLLFEDTMGKGHKVRTHHQNVMTLLMEIAS